MIEHHLHYDTIWFIGGKIKLRPCIWCDKVRMKDHVIRGDEQQLTGSSPLSGFIFTILHIGLDTHSSRPFLFWHAPFFYTHTHTHAILDIGCAIVSTIHHSIELYSAPMLTRNYTAADDPSSSSQADSRLSLGSPLSQGGDTDDSPSREYTSSRIIYAHQSMDVDGDDDDDDDMHPTRPSTTLSDFDQQRFEQDVLDLSIAHHSSYAVGGSDRVLRSMRHAHDTNMGRRRALSSNNEQHTIGSETLLPSSNRRNNLRFAYQRQTSTNGSINHNEDGRDRSTPSNSTNHHQDQEQQRQREGLEALTRIETQFAELRNRYVINHDGRFHAHLHDSRIYQERMAELNREALMISQGNGNFKSI